MRHIALILALPLAACASVEERTDARSGAGFTNASSGGDKGVQTTTVDMSMRGLAPVPIVNASGGATNQADAAQVAMAAGGADAGNWAAETIGEDTYALRQVRADGFDFVVADPQTRGAPLSPQLVSQTAVRTGCKTTGQTWEDSGRYAIALNCR